MATLHGFACTCTSTSATTACELLNRCVVLWKSLVPSVPRQCFRTVCGHAHCAAAEAGGIQAGTYQKPGVFTRVVGCLCKGSRVYAYR